MSFELSKKDHIRSFYSILKSFSLNSDKCLLFFHREQLFFLQNYEDLPSFHSEKMTTICRFKPGFFTIYSPKNFPCTSILIEFQINTVCRQFNSFKKKMQSFVLEFPSLLERASIDLRQVFEMDLQMKFICGTFTVIKRLTVENLQNFDYGVLMKEIDGFSNNTFWKRVLEFKSGNTVNLAEFKNLFIDIVLDSELVICKQGDVSHDQLDYYTNIKREKLEDYSNDVCLKDFEGKNKLQLSANKLLNYLQICKENKRNSVIFISKKQSNGIHRMLLPLMGFSDYECYYLFCGMLEKADETDIIKCIYDPGDDLMKSEMKDEKGNEENDGESSLEELDLNEIDKAMETINSKNREIIISRRESDLNQKTQFNNSAISYFGFLNEEAEKMEDIEEPKTNQDSRPQKIEKRKDFERIPFETNETKKKKIKTSATEFRQNEPSARTNTTGGLVYGATSLFQKSLETISQVKSTGSLNFMNKSQLFDKSNNFVKDPSYILKNRDFFK